MTTETEAHSGNEQEAEHSVSLSRKQLDALERRAKAGDAAVRRAAFLEAGVDMAHPGASYFVKGYDGEVSADAIRKAAEEAGFLAKPQAPSSTGAASTSAEAGSGGDSEEQQGLSQEDLDDMARLTRLTAVGSNSADTSGVNHAAEMERVAQAAAKAGDNVPSAIAAYMMRVGLPVAGDDQ